MEEIKVKINSDFEISKFEATMIEGGIYKDGSLKDNEEFKIDNLLGFAEKVSNRW